ncbi:hypothetical protein [Rickettsiella endosymbiont of Xylota segnis]|uniref:hypothetical protein n=1 Tax=Rickettsiella endosymbiont of Xylota segnis TaxID=3066238 RepID=UPI0030CCE56C
MFTIPLQTLEALHKFGIKNQIFSSEDNDPLKALFYDTKDKASKNAKAENLSVDLEKLNKDQLEKFIKIQNSKIFALKSNHHAPSKKYSVEESVENKFWARLKTSLKMGLAFLPIAIFVSFMIALVAPHLVAPALFLTCLAYGTPIFFSIGAILGAFIKTPKEFQKDKYERNYEKSLSAENSLLNTFEKELGTRTPHEKQNSLEVNNTIINTNNPRYTEKMFTDPTPEDSNSNQTYNNRSPSYK